jgi:hypothetical protein
LAVWRFWDSSFTNGRLAFSPPIKDTRPFEGSTGILEYTDVNHRKNKKGYTYTGLSTNRL